MHRLPALLAALVLPTVQPLLLGVAVSTGTLLVSQTPAQAQSAEAVARVAQAITVRIESATQGSGVLVKREGNRYTVLTAWHVVSGHRPGEELDIYTPDGQRHSVVQGSIKRLGDVDMAVLTFTSSGTYETARVADAKSVSMGNAIFVAGFPLPSSAVPTRLLRFLKGDVIANAKVAIPDGYQLLYSNPTLPGMSGGAVLDAQGQLVGIHGRGETDIKLSEKHGVAVKTGTNQAVPIAYYSQYASGAAVIASTAQATTADDYLAQARELLVSKKGSEQKVIRLASRVLAISQNAEAYFYRAYAKDILGDKQGAIADWSKAIAINPQYHVSYYNRGIAKNDIGDSQGAIVDYSRAIALDPEYADAYGNRGKARYDLGDNQGAIADYDQALAINPQGPYVDYVYHNRGNAKLKLGYNQGAIVDFDHAIAINPRLAEAYISRGNIKFNLGDTKDAIADWSQAIAINPQFAEAYYNRGTAKYLLGDEQGAIADLSQAIAINPQFADAYMKRGTVKLNARDNRGAIADLSQAIAINPQFSEAYLNRGAAKYRLGDKRGAIEDYSQSIATDPKIALAYVNRGKARSDFGDKKSACSDYKLAVSLGYKLAADWLQSDDGEWCRNMR